MKKWILKFLGLTRYQVVIDGPLPTIDKADDEAIKTLQYHPGFIALTNRFKVQSALLRARLERERNTPEDDNYLKSGIFWSKFYLAEVDRLVNKKDLKPTAVTSYDVMAEFDRVNSQFERVG